MRFYMEQFGCRATQADGAAIERQLRAVGGTAVPTPTSADVVVVNTCTVTAAADTQARDAIRKIHALNPAAHVIVTGCYAQRAPEELAGLPGVSWVVGNSHKPEIPNLLASFSPGIRDFFSVEALQVRPASGVHAPGMGPQHSPLHGKILVGDMAQQTEVLTAPVSGGEGSHTRPTLKIQDGCNSRCSYCVIPFVRGRSRSLPPESVIREIRHLCACGFREIVLSGINLGSYGRDLSPRVEFIDLLRQILEDTAVERLRTSSIEPLDVTRDLIALFAATERVAQHFHMPLQSGSDRILAAMHRWYRAEHYARRVELIREHLPHAAIGADVITGFPGETPSDHAATLDFIERRPFTYLHVFSFSKRPGTKAASLSNEVPGATIKHRARELRALGEAKAMAFRDSQIGRTLRVLTLRSYADHPADCRELPFSSITPNLASSGRSWSTPALSSNYLRVRIPGSYPANLWLPVLVSVTEGNYLVGQPALSETNPFGVSRASSAPWPLSL
jgi:threonylcarbamoyladenosine tRNA methylthiotransferase MtaB